MLIELYDENIISLFDILLKDKNTGKNIMWCTNDYLKYGDNYRADCEITRESLNDMGTSLVDLLQPRVTKSKEIQKNRTKVRAEVFTPSEICKYMNNYCEKDWLEKYLKVQNLDKNTITEKFLKSYIDVKKLEITCGEAPFVVSRYDTTTGEIIPLYNRIGFLDRKLTAVCDYACDMDDWFNNVCRAYESCYGYEYQGDNLFKARLNLVQTFIDYYLKKWVRGFPTPQQLKKVSNIVIKNFWQMDGLTYTVPNTDIKCKVHNWRTKKNMELVGEGSMKFDYIVGNPPYQGENHKQIYPDFYEQSTGVSKDSGVVCLIFPSGWQAPTNANNLGKMNREEVKADKQIVFIDNRDDAFPGVAGAKNTNIVLWKKGYNNKLNGKQLIYTNGKNPIEKTLALKKEDVEIDPILMKIKEKVVLPEFQSITSIMYLQNKYNLSLMLSEHPECRSQISCGNDKRLRSNAFKKVYLFSEVSNSNTIKIYGLLGSKRVYRYIDLKYIETNIATYKYKILMPVASGGGTFGSALSPFEISEPGVGYTETFMAIGAFEYEKDAKNCFKYLKTKFVRALLGILKTNQNGKREVWEFVPIQDFTENSDIDWSVSVSEIDKQLYKKYGLDENEIKFIEEKVKEME